MRNIKIFTTSQAAAQFPKLIELAAAGEDVVIVNRRTKQIFQITVQTTNGHSPRKGHPRNGLPI
jgi:hypothetical protein